MSRKQEASDADPSLEWIAQQIALAQRPLYAYVCAMLGSSHDASDVLQEANLVLWRKSAEFDAARPFLPWAYGIARLQVLAHREKQSRDRHVFSEAAMARIAERVLERDDDLELRSAALEQCLARLPARQRAAIRMRYEQEMAVASIAETCGRSDNAVATQLYRARLALAQCIKRALAGGDS